MQGNLEISGGGDVTQTELDAVADAQFIVAAADADLTAERVATNTTSITWDFATAAQAKAVRAALTGDVTAGSDSNATTIAANAVSDTKLRDSGALSVVGRSANSTGDPADISATAASGAVLRESGSVLGFGTVATAGIANNAITDAKIRQSAGLSVIGRSANTTGDVADITGTDGQALRVSGTAVGFGTIATAGIADNAITDGKLRDSAAVSVIGRSANTSGDPADIAAGANDQFLVRRANALAFVGGIVADGSGAIQQIVFAATQSASSDANTLDDYEEGSWTPVLGGSGGTSGQTYVANGQVGRYIKVARVVFCNVYLELSAKGTITGDVQIQGLPFATANVANGFSVMPVIWFRTATSFVDVNCYLSPNTTVAPVVGKTAAATDASSPSMTTTDIGDTTGILGTFAYLSAS